MLRPSTLFLLHPEWQGYGESPEVHHGATSLAGTLFAGRPVVTIDAPDIEVLVRRDGVLGLDSIAARFARTRALIRQAAPDRIVTIGGTCGTELAPVSYLNERYAGEMAVLWLDAHGDLNTPASSPSGHFHGMALRTLFGDGPDELTCEIARTLEPRQVCLLGARDLDPPEAAFIAAAPIARFGLEAFTDPGVLTRRLRAEGFTRAYVHLDMDVINPNSLATALLEVPGGPSAAQVHELISAIAACVDVVGFSILEYVEGEASAKAEALLTKILDSVVGVSGDRAI